MEVRADKGGEKCLKIRHTKLYVTEPVTHERTTMDNANSAKPKRDIERNVERTRCRIAEIVQYDCRLETVDGKPQVHCFPFPRIFRL